jgi:hypothetical protein
MAAKRTKKDKTISHYSKYFTNFALNQQFNNSTINNMDITNILGALTGNDAVGAIADNLKIDSKQVSSVITSALPTLLGAMQKNASTPGGAEALAKALGDHAGNSGNIVNNLKAADLVDGKKILGHIFGGNLSSILGGISKNTGVGSNAVGSILASIAPSLLALLGKGQQSSGTNAAGLESMLGMILGGMSSSSNSSMGGLGSILGGLGSILGK